MSQLYPSSKDFTSENLEKEIITRFRSLVKFLPPKCRIFRETWDTSTVLCLDFDDCPSYLPISKVKSPLLSEIAQKLGISQSISFKMGNRSMGWVTLPVKESQ
ncbi:hypothetical protein C7H19_20645 [Aphanothece hegewaldii CCALA 016]|uniref:Uncharacterized protein n=1 Tax=Aphanothece hegewaldii CCALA 016 TaxID=2107694 RepID=A0A2T1LSS3_9CHRO|nr:hypothetical protein [Aphanothece hegewaldii]PSF33105.1 hypothetical protein C7H19_20645 [Aphanothece hegewaldii CCALA 016]